MERRELAGLVGMALGRWPPAYRLAEGKVLDRSRLDAHCRGDWYARLQHLRGRDAGLSPVLPLPGGRALLLNHPGKRRLNGRTNS